MATLRDYIIIKHGYAFKGQNISTIDNNVVLVTPVNFAIGGGFKEDKCKYFDAEYPDDYVLKADDLIVTMTDLSKAIDTLGYSALVPDGKSKRVYLHNQRIGLVTINSNELNKHYIYWFMRSSYYQKMIAATSTGSTVHHTSPDRILDIEIELPKLEKQNKIAAFLDNIENLIQLNVEINNNLERQARAIFDTIFPSISNGENTIGDIITPKRGKGLLSKNAVFGNVPVVAGGLEPSTYHNVANTVAPVLAISASGANSGYVSLWNIPIWSSDSSYIDSSMTDDVYFWYVLLKKRQKEIYDAQTGSAQPHIYPQHIAAMAISNLNFDDVRNYTATVTPIFKMIGHNKDENVRLTTTRDTLLPKLMSGELDVSNIDF